MNQAEEFHDYKTVWQRARDIAQTYTKQSSNSDVTPARAGVARRGSDRL